MVNWVYQSINITNLLLNTNNPRFSPLEFQAETIEAMVRDQQEKLTFLAQHIVDHGLNPTDPILVKPHNDQWIVREGNRRITALKIVNEPSLIPSDYPKLRRDFQQLNKLIDNSLLQNIPCVILKDEVEINEWVRLKHTGQNNGAGTVGWDGQQTSRFRTYVEGKPDMRLDFLDYLKTLVAVPSDLKANLGNIKKTNFDRLIGDPDVRNFLGLEIENNALTLKNGVNRYLLFVLGELVNDQLSVGKIYHKSDRKKYIEELKSKCLLNDDSTHFDATVKGGNRQHDTRVASVGRVEQSVKQSSTANGEGTKENRVNPHGVSNNSTKKASHPINRKSLVVPGHKLTIGHARILKIFNELKSMIIEDYPNAVSVLFRAFIELSADYYLEKHKLITGKLNVDSSLGNKIDAIAAYMKHNMIMNDTQLRPIRQMTSSSTQNLSIRTFHSYVHNKDITPSSTDLKAAWDDIWPFIEKMWE